MSGLQVTDVFAYRLTGQESVKVVLKIHDVSYTPVSGSPALLAYFDAAGGHFSYGTADSVIPYTLSPGNTTYATAWFATPDITGTLTLRSNDNSNLLLASCALASAG
jgi:hypothetical protein